MIKRVKGTQDFIDLSLFNFLVNTAKKHLRSYNFSEIKTPILEYTDLFKRSLGLQTDVITKEMYTVNTTDNNELSSNKKDSICLRPEATAPTVRAFIDNNITLTPWKVFSYGSMFRHERPQKGRYKEFHQINIESIGALSIYEDVKFISMLERLFSDNLELDSYALEINFLGCFEDREKFKVKLDKVLEEHKSALCEKCLIRKDKNILRVFDCKNKKCKELYSNISNDEKNIPYIADDLCLECAKEWKILQEELESLSVSFTYKPTLVRGLDYYDKTVFEFVSLNLGAQNAFCSGGRYNKLAKQLGAKEDQPSIGAAIGVERMLLLLENKKDALVKSSDKLFVIIPLSQEEYSLSLLISDQLSNLNIKNIKSDIILNDKSIKSKMRKADKMQADYIILLGSDEREQHKVTIKDMKLGESLTIPQAKLIDYIKGIN